MKLRKNATEIEIELRKVYGDNNTPSYRTIAKRVHEFNHECEMLKVTHTVDDH